MSHINLLPWREEARQKAQQQFLVLLALILVLMAGIVFGVTELYDARIKGQVARNQYLQKEIKILDQKIAEIAELKEKEKNLAQRMNLIEQLQSNRNTGTIIFNDIAQAVPSGVHLTKLTRKNNALLIVGKTESNSRVANMMRRIEKSSRLESPILESIIGDKENLNTLSEFRMQVHLSDTVTEEPQQKGKQGDQP